MTVVPHPYATTLDQDMLTSGELSRLLSAQPNGQFRALVRENDASACAALEGAGFLKVRRTWEGLVRLSDVNFSTLAAAHACVIKAGLSIGLLGRPMLEDWLRSHERAYRRCHAANPLAPLDDAGRVTIFANDLRLEAAFVIHDGSRVMAHASLREDPDGWAFGWFGAEPDGKIFSETLNKALKHLEIDFALRMGLDALWFENDSTDPQAMALASDLPFSQPEVWLTYQTKARFEANS